MLLFLVVFVFWSIPVSVRSFCWHFVSFSQFFFSHVCGHVFICSIVFILLYVILCLFLVLWFVVFCFPLCGLSVSFQVFFISAWLFCVFLWSSCILCGHASLCTLMDSRQEMSTVAPKDPGLCPVGLLLSNPTKVVPQV